MKTFELGIMSELNANRIFNALDGKTFMKFRVSLGICPSGMNVELSTDYEEADVEILTFAMGCLAENI